MIRLACAECQRAASTRPRQAPKPIGTAPGALQRALSVSSSPSSRKLRSSPLASVSGAFPPWLISSSEPSPLDSATDSVPVPMRSPGIRLQPFELWWATICAADQYIAAAAMYWSAAQIVTHHSSNGCNLMPGDLIGTGTLSVAEATGLGSLLEISQGGKRPLDLPGGERRSFLDDGDELILSARCSRAGAVTIGFGECRGTVTAAR